MKAKKFPVMFIVFISLVACSQNPGVPMESAVTPTFTPWVEGTEMALATPTPWAEGTEVAFASPTPWVSGTQTAQAVASQIAPSITDVQVVIEKPTDFSPVLYGGKMYDTEFFLLLGGVSRDAWITPDESVERFSGEVTYSLHNMEYVDKYFLWGKAPEFSPTCKVYTIGADAGLDEAGFVATLDGWNVTKRDVTELSADGEFYQQVVTDWLTEKGVSKPQLDSIHVYRVDLEGDGTDEIFISASHLDDSQHTTKAGDYSIILMRKVIGNNAVTDLVVGDVYDSKDQEITYPRTYSLANFIDLNQDGVLEVVVSFQKWEGFGASVFQIDGQNVTQTLSAGC